LTAKEFTGIFPANQVNDDIELSDESGKVLEILDSCVNNHKKTKVLKYPLSDFIAPKTVVKRIIWVRFV
jgi:5-methyltetrahydrofolate--homocysteine methyltransferase